MSESKSSGSEQLKGQLDPWNVTSVVDGRRGVSETDVTRLAILVTEQAKTSSGQRSTTPDEMMKMGQMAHGTLNALAWALRASSDVPSSEEYRSNMSGLHGVLRSFGELVRVYAPDVPELVEYSSEYLPPKSGFIQSPADVLGRYDEKGLLINKFPNPTLLHGLPESMAVYGMGALTDIVWENNSFMPLDTEGERRFQLLTDSYLQLIPILGE